jgi:hypothetical protein
VAPRARRDAQVFVHPIDTIKTRLQARARAALRCAFAKHAPRPRDENGKRNALALAHIITPASRRCAARSADRRFPPTGV